MKKTLSTYYLYFVLYSIIGWIYETFLEVVVYRWGFSPREYLYGPYCPIYGFGALIFLFTPQQDSDYMLTVAEIMASFRMGE